MPNPDEQIIKRKLLEEAKQWCSERLDDQNLRDSLRSEEIQPSYLCPNRQTIVSLVVSTRSSLLTLNCTDTPKGRILVYYPDISLSDGAAQAESRGFFDVHNVPPWDTWLMLTADRAGDTILLSWVPQELVQLVGASMRINPEDCLVWLEDSSVTDIEIWRLLLSNI
jgi:hypothetical protein